MSDFGKVFLIGAGPGDPGLLTLRGKEVLERADVVVYDRLVSPAILSMCNAKAKMVDVGKMPTHHKVKQSEINKLLVHFAREIPHGVIARLKGGDPFVFGRGGEEAIELLEAGQPFEFVPGVTSAIAVAEYAGIPVTHRGIAASFAVVTGHEDPAKENSDIHWDKLATATDTVVFLMGVANIPKITEKLIEFGRNPKTPVAIIRWGTRPQQQVWTTTLDDAPAMAIREGIKAPSIFLVGEVVKLRERLCWFDNKENKPMFGKRVLVTRARAQASKLTVSLEELGADVWELPAIAIQSPTDNYAELDTEIENIKTYDWLIFTSTNGVEHFFQEFSIAIKFHIKIYQIHFAHLDFYTQIFLKLYLKLPIVLLKEYQQRKRQYFLI